MHTNIYIYLICYQPCFVFAKMTIFMKVLRKLFPVPGWNEQVEIDSRFKNIDNNIKQVFSKDSLVEQDFKELFNYFVEGIDAYHRKGSATVDYPGVPGSRGRFVEGIEGFARCAPLLASWLYSGRDEKIVLSNGKIFEIDEYVKKAMSAGTAPEHPAYWGRIQDYDQRAVEAGDIAVTYKLLKTRYPHAFSDSDHKNIRNWLSQINKVKLYGGNWCLFTLIINCVLSDDEPCYEKQMTEAYEEFKSFHVGDGWFGDGKGGIADFYNAWQFYYFLFWFNKFKPDYDIDFIKTAVSEFSSSYIYFFSTEGFPIFGRSLSYRTALPVPLIVDTLINGNNSQSARRALEVTWSHFVKNDALRGGTLTQGYYGSQPFLMENYSGRGSSLWGIRSLTMAFLNPSDSNFWTCMPEKLPIEKGDYDVTINGPQFRLIGKRETKQVKLIRTPVFQNSKSNQKITGIGFLRNSLQTILRRPLRPDNLHIKYGREEYLSDEFFCK